MRCGLRESSLRNVLALPAVDGVNRGLSNCARERMVFAMDDFMEQRIKELREVKEKAALGGGQARIDKLHQKGKLTAQERLDKLLDPGSFVELQMLVGHAQGNPRDGLYAGYGTIDGRTVCVFSQDATVQGGSIGPIHGFKMARTIERATEMQVPVIGLNDSPGFRNPRLQDLQGMQEGRVSEGVAGSDKNMFFANTQASGVIPQISAILGSCGGISVYSPALTDFVFMVESTSHMFITGPRIVKSVMGEDLTMDELGGAKIHAKLSGVADFRMESEDDCFNNIRRLLSFLPSNCNQSPARIETGDSPDRVDEDLADMVPSDPNKAFDIRQLIKRLVDNGDFFEVKPDFAGEMVIGFARLNGYSVGIVANQPMVRAGSLTVDSSDKESRFIRFCDCFNIPMVFLIDTPAYQPGSQQESAGIIRHGAKVLYALCEAVVPRVAVILRKAYGGGNLGMGTIPGMGTDLIYSWPIVEMGVMGAAQSVDLFFGEMIKASPDPEATKEQMIKEYRQFAANPLMMASFNPFTEDVIEPKDTRRVLIRSMELLKDKKIARQPKRHGNIPL